MYFGVLIIFTYILLGFWMLIFLSLFIPVMLGLTIMDLVSPAMAAKTANSLMGES